MKCPYCAAELDCTDINQDKKDVYECVWDNRVFVVPTGSTQEQIDALVDEKKIVPTADFEWDSTFFGGNYDRIDSSTTQVPVALIEKLGDGDEAAETAFELFTHVNRCHIVSIAAEESEAYGHGKTQEELDAEQQYMHAFADEHTPKCAYCEVLAYNRHEKERMTHNEQVARNIRASIARLVGQLRGEELADDVVHNLIVEETMKFYHGEVQTRVYEAEMREQVSRTVRNVMEQGK